MPAPYAVLTPPVVVRPRLPRVPPVLSLTGGNGDTVSLVGYADGLDVIAVRGLFSPPKPELRLREGAGDGARYDGQRFGPRSIDLRLRAHAGNGPQMRAVLARLADITDMAYGPMVLGAATEAGATAARTIGVLFNGGWDGDDTGMLFQDIPLTLTAPDPFFSAAEPVTDFITLGSGKPYFAEPYFPVELAPSRALGQLTLANPGDVTSHVRWTFAGPGTALTAVQGESGLGFMVNAELAGSDVRVVDTETKSLRDGGGVDVYEEFSPAPKFWTVPPGSSSAFVSMENASRGSRIDIAFWPRFKLAA